MLKHHVSYRWLCIALCTGLLEFSTSAFAAAQLKTPVLFDFGTESSPIDESAVRVTATHFYNARDNFGWLSKAAKSFDRDRALQNLSHRGNPMRPDLLYRMYATPLTRDGVASLKDMQFRINVKPGTYRVHVWVGDVHHALESLAVACNGKPVATGISAKQALGRAGQFATGSYRLIRFTFEAKDGRIDLRFHGDELPYKADKALYDRWFGGQTQVASYLGNPWDPNRRLKFDPKGPFTRNSVLAVRVFPHADPFFEWKGSKLVASGKQSTALRHFLATFNSEKYRDAEAILDGKAVPLDLRIRGYLALLGHPKVEGNDEARILFKAKKVTAHAMKSAPGVWAVEAHDSLEIFGQARHRFWNRGMAEEGHFQENRKVINLLHMFRPGDLLYYQALEYQGRALQMLDPHRWTMAAGDAQRVWKKLIRVFPQNRYARFYLTDQWTPDSYWRYGKHLTETSGVPKWALAQKEAVGLLFDMCEWWAENKQHPDGSIGGGWGDDVELVALFGIMGFISEDASKPSLRLANTLIDGLWKYGGIDRQAGFYRDLLDAEHSAEWTGDTLPLMLTVAWGNPLWIERATKTAKLMRNLWMDHNDRGDFHFRGNFLSSMSVGNAKQANDSYINYRATLPAIAVYRYNRNPAVGKLFVKWADAWVNVAMRSARGMPRGVFPAEVGFPCGEPGGVNSPNWYTAAHPPGTVNYDWERGQYYGYLVDLMLLAYEISGQEKYLEPFRLQKVLVEKYRENPVVKPKAGSAAWVGKLLGEGNRRGRPPFDVIWKKVQKAKRQANTKDEPPVFVTKDEVTKSMNLVRREVKRRWPVLTTETSATDRVGFRGIGEPFFAMAGTRGFDPSVTYAGVGRDFAAFVKRTSQRHLQLVMYNFSKTNKKATVLPWKLQTGATYQLQTGIDTNEDGKPDRDIRQLSFVLKQRGQRVTFSFPPRSTTIVEIRRIKPGKRPPLLADLAVISREIKYSIWTRELQVNIHNVGSQTARKITVALYENTDKSGIVSHRKKIGAVTIPYLSWPMDLENKSMNMAIPYVPTQSRVSITVVIDEQQQIEEVCESNNQATRQFNFNLQEIQAPRKRRGEIGGDITGEIKGGIR